MKYSQHMAVCRGRQCTQWGKKLETTVLEESTCSGTFPNGHLVQLTMTVRLKGRSSPGQDSLGKHSFHGRLDSGCICSYWPRGGKKKKWHLPSPASSSPSVIHSSSSPQNLSIQVVPFVALPWTPTAMINGPKLHSIMPKVRRCRKQWKLASAVQAQTLGILRNNLV